MLTKPSAELTLFDTLSRLTFTRAAKLLGPKGNRLIATGGKFDIDLTTQVKFDRDMFRLTLDGAAVTPLNPSRFSMASRSLAESGPLFDSAMSIMRVAS